MKTGVARGAATVAGVLGWMAIAGCDGGNGTGVTDPVPTTVLITPDSAKLTWIGATLDVTAVVRDQNGEVMPDAAVTWTSTDAGVVTVSGGDSAATVTATGNGTAMLAATSDEASDTATVVVEQEPAALEVVSGDDQHAVRGTALPVPLVVRVDDLGGTGVPGVPVIFVPDEGHGSVSADTVETGAEGTASTVWTLGTGHRTQSLSVFSGEFTRRFVAAAIADPPIADLEFGAVTFSRDEPTVFEPVAVVAEIDNLGDGATPAAFTMEVLVDGETERTIDVGPLQPGATGTVEFGLGPFGAGSREVGLVLDPGGQVEEWDEGNNAAVQNIRVVDQQPIALDESVELASVSAGTVRLFRVEIDEASDEALNVGLSGGDGDADLFVDFEDRPAHQYRYLCGSLEPATTEMCQMVPARRGVYHVAVHAWSAFGPTTLTVTLGGEPVEDYGIDLDFVEGGTAAQRDIIGRAAARWDAVIAKGAPDIDFSAVASTPCGPSESVAADVVDDLRIYVTVDSIDGAGGSGGNTVAQAGWCAARAHTFVSPAIWKETITGFIRFDEHDMEALEQQGMLESVAVHEIAHVLGFDPFLWTAHEHLRDPWGADNPEADTHFDGYLAVEAFDAAGGAAYEGARVPVERSAVAGSPGAHWRHSVLGDEIMTPMLTGASQPLSLITIEALADLGYGVDPGRAEPFSLSVPGRPGGAMGVGPAVDLGNDIVRGPVVLYDLKTGGVRVVHPPAPRPDRGPGG